MDFFGAGGVAAATSAVNLDGGFHVTIGLLSGEDEDRCQSILTGPVPKTRLVSHKTGQQQEEVEQVTELSADMRAYREAYLLAAIKEWNVTEGGAVCAIDMEHIRRLPSRYRNQIFIAAKAFNEPPSPGQLGE